MPKTRVLLTVDTEPSIAGAMQDRQRYAPLLEEPVWGEVNGRSEALGFITRTLTRYNLHATFFVETAHTRHFGDGPMGRCAQHLTAAGQDVQLHLHPVWRNFTDPPPARCDDNSGAMPAAELTALIREGCGQIEAWTGQRPCAMRTGNFATSLQVYEAMAEAGLHLASNLCIASSAYSEPELQRAGGVHRIAGVDELAVSCFVDPGPVGRGRYRATQITACSASELVDLLNQCSRQSVGTLVVVTHPFEFIKRGDFRYSDMRPNRLVQRRFDTLCRFLDGNRERFDVSTFANLGRELPLAPEPPPRLQGSTMRSLLRATQNFINDRI